MLPTSGDIENFKQLVNDKKGWRIDLVAITLDSRNKPNINHYENI